MSVLAVFRRLDKCRYLYTLGHRSDHTGTPPGQVVYEQAATCSAFTQAVEDAGSPVHKVTGLEGLSIRVDGAEARLDWRQEETSGPIFKPVVTPAQVLKQANGFLREEAKMASRLPPGHPEALIEGFANVYASVARIIRSRGAVSVSEVVMEDDSPTI